VNKEVNIKLDYADFQNLIDMAEQAIEDLEDKVSFAEGIVRGSYKELLKKLKIYESK